MEYATCRIGFVDEKGVPSFFADEKLLGAVQQVKNFITEYEKIDIPAKTEDVSGLAAA